jgi:hypothetical protein
MIVIIYRNLISINLYILIILVITNILLLHEVSSYNFKNFSTSRL